MLAALLVGTVLGAVSRAFMALVSLASTGSSTFSWSGTSFIVLLYTVVMVPGGVVAGLTTRPVRWLLPVAGALFLCLPAVGVARAEVGATTGFDALDWLGVGGAGAAVFATIGLAPWLTVRLTDRWLGRRPSSVRHAQPAGPAAATP